MLVPIIVVGKGNPVFFNFAAHGAGRQMSRKKAKDKYCWESVEEYLKCNNVKLITGGLNECPGAYKPIEEVMKSQSDLV